MVSLFRSEEMTLAQLFLQSDSAYACVRELGELGKVLFRDLNPDVNAFQRKFVSEVRRCDELERKLRFLKAEMEKESIPIKTVETDYTAPLPREMIDLEARLDHFETDIREINKHQMALKKNLLDLIEFRAILSKASHFFIEAEDAVFHQAQEVVPDEGSKSLLIEDGMPEKSIQSSRPMSFLSGVINRDHLAAFERVIWRTSRGNAFFRHVEIETPLEDPKTGDMISKCAFMIFLQGNHLRSRMMKICEGFSATVYPCSDNAEVRRDAYAQVETRIQDLKSVINETEDHRYRVLNGTSNDLVMWMIQTKKMKAIYHTLNMFNVDITQKCLIAECWCPVQELDNIQCALKRGTDLSGSSVPSILNRMITKLEPPTYYQLNKFTSAFQNIVDAYGVATYREANPDSFILALFTVITFPFLFAVMFGDSGHGLLMFLFGLWLVLNEKKFTRQKNMGEIFNTIFGGRYVVLLMGIFAVYTGLIYNDCFSLSFNIFGTSWTFPNISEGFLHDHPTYQLDPNVSFPGGPYVFGIDPIWQTAINKLTFLNSYKMKLSVIFGVFQMLFGVILSLYNSLYFKKYSNIFCEFIPQVLFLNALFGYLVALIFYKWIVVDVRTEPQPRLLILMINMFIKFAQKLQPSEILYHGQETVNLVLVVVAVLCVPWMLLIKPFYLRWKHKRKLRSYRPKTRKGGNVYVQLSDDDGMNDEYTTYHNDESQLSENSYDEEEEFDFGNIMVLQAIHTIEFCLGCISNTASYLRLWALSLAHAELSEVLWNMVLHIGLSFKGYVGSLLIFATFCGWAGLTIAILLVMEGLSAFLHALRLHWVEFQNKFYSGEGYLFDPFSFEKMLKEDEDLEDIL
ncbi:uncharacterized protein TRIADDRAFT_63670 [Trichoplax adhaerens]|uniref:V-type proton ATPase subunit a n=1 Tax=Trichoplax adhaerens TaxID=10228 RepID=B3RPM2_TRIAD|nr:hypothetical protein TRIADDRAFT_63670 [Trichoplax adhaerens]EDV27659.1 hypothetical protein TRIADDRAFT_63670 [Trichoplax adhaerens]|eukprot:XP_002109493.1 hypothetical protein TRIADDRAFT_63670 [Trichoplax adhaerens]